MSYVCSFAHPSVPARFFCCILNLATDWSIFLGLMGLVHQRQINDKEIASRARQKITPQPQTFSYSWSIFVCYIRSKHFRLLCFMASLGVCSLLSCYSCRSRGSRWLHRSSLSIDNWLPHSGMLLCLHHRNSKLFFHPAKFDNFKDEKISDFKTVSVSQSKNLLDWKLVV